MHNAFLLFRRQKANMDKSDLLWKQPRRNYKTEYNKYHVTDKTKHIGLCSYFIIVNYMYMYNVQH